jgi:predicted esterase
MKPHGGGPVLTTGERVENAAGAMIMVHGRGADARSILKLAASLGESDVSFLAPEAAGNSWYPYSFLEEISRNEPGLSSGLVVLDNMIADLGASGIDPERIFLLGFSQGACLSLEYAARYPRRYGGVIGLSGGLIGSKVTPTRYEGSLRGTPVFLGCSDIDPHIPRERVEETGLILQGMDAVVDKRLYPGMPHTINEDELEAVRLMMGSLRG